jgi:hypothetical protein
MDGYIRKASLINAKVEIAKGQNGHQVIVVDLLKLKMKSPV